MLLTKLLTFSLVPIAYAAPSVSTVTKTVTKTTTKTTTKTSTKTTTKIQTSTVNVCQTSPIDIEVPTSPTISATPTSSPSSTNLVPTAPPTNSIGSTSASTRSSSTISSTAPVTTLSLTSRTTTSISTSSTSPRSSTTTSSVVAPTNTGTPSGKIALAWANQQKNSIANFVNKNVSMVYTWSVYCPPQAKALNLLCCPMLWGPQKLAQFQSLAVPGYSTCVAGFNEPMVKSQSNMTPQQAADLWMSAIHPLTQQGYTTVIGPAILTSTSGIAWMQEFVKLCPQCYADIDIIAVHTYNINATKAIANYNQIHALYPDKQMAITEFACQSFYSGDPYKNCTVDQAKAFMLAIMKFVENTKWMRWAAYFGMFKANEIGGGVYKTNAMIGDDSMPNALGQAYLNS
ncbi:hypothetical protein AURDEDRAFT_157141 [Auricularia subglabra TFB-10046 SS5]|nr:hypothetical protein AURDEDRAFT_157141 [Auricularia subglabra TFB-10046 SS5]